MPRLLDPSGTVAIILGAHDWSKAGLSNAPSFRRSAAQLHRYLLNPSPRGLELEPDLVLSLFDDPSPASVQLGRIRDAVRALIRERSSEDRAINDVLIYYVGHGAFDDSGHLHLLVRDSSEGIEAQSSIAALDLAQVMRVAAPQQRRLVILDCCFSEAAVAAFGAMSGALEDAVASTALKDLASVPAAARGTLLLCSSPRRQVSIGKPNAERTLFTGALLSALDDGADHIAEEMLSFFDLREAIFDRMLREHDSPPRPALHQPEQQAGDLTRLPAFPNAALVRRAEGHRKAGEKEERKAEQADRLAEEQRRSDEATRLAGAQREAKATHLAEVQHEPDEEKQRIAEAAWQMDAPRNACEPQAGPRPKPLRYLLTSKRHVVRLIYLITIITMIPVAVATLYQFRAPDEAIQRQAQQKTADEAAQRQAQRTAADEAIQRQAQQKADEVAQRQAQQKSADEAIQRQAQQKTADEVAQRQAQQKTADEVAQRQAQQKTADEVAQRQAQQKAADEAAQRQAQQKAADEAAQRQAQRWAADEAARPTWCDGAATAMEKLICGDPRLWPMDIDLNGSYLAVIRRLSPSDRSR
jgi:hypothetical protein